MANPCQGITARLSFWVVGFALICLGVVAGGLAYYRFEQNNVRRAQYQELSAIADMRIQLIERWRQERLGDANSMTRSPFVRQAVATWLQDPGNSGVRSTLLEMFKLMQEGYGYKNIYLASPTGKILLSLGPDPAYLCPREKQALDAALSGRQAVLGDLFRCPRDQRVYLDAAAPILDHQGQPLAVVLFVIDPVDCLYSLIQAWPNPNPSAETLLVELDGKDVLFLNDLRHRQKTALSLREPLSRTDLPAAQAIQGKQGMFEGKDYRGVEVLADLRPVPPWPWFMVTKVDRAEIMAEARYRAMITILFVGLFILLTGAVAAYGYRRRQFGLLQVLYLMEQEQRQAQEEFRTTLYSIGDAVITTDTAGLVKQMNPEAERLTGWPEAEASGKSLKEVFHIVNEQTRTLAENPVHRVLREGQVAGLANHTLLIARDGAEHPIADSGAPIRDDRGAVIGVVLVFRDQTQERAAQQALQESEELYRSLFDNILNGFAFCKMLFEQNQPQDFIYLDVNESFEALTGLKNVVGKKVSEVIPGLRESDPELFEIYGRVALTGKPERFEYYVEALKMWFSISVYSPKKEHFVAVFDVITARKQAEEALRASEERYRTVADYTHDMEYWINEAGEVLYMSPSCERFTGYPAQAFIDDPQLLNHIVHPQDIDLFMHHGKEVYSSTETCNLDFRLIHRNGQELWVNHNCQPVFGIDRRPLGRRASNRDITERKRVEEALQQSETKFRELVENMSSAVGIYQAVADGENFIFLEVNRALERIEQVKRADLLGRTVTEVFPGIKDFGLFEVFQRVWRTGIPEGFPVAWYEDQRISGWRSNYIYKLPSGAIVTVYDDVTEQKQAEAALRESEENHRLLVNQIPAVVFRGYGDWSVDFFDHKIDTLTGFHKEEFDSRKIKWCDLILPEDLINARQIFTEALKADKSYQREYRIQRKDGEIRWIQASGRIFCDDTGKVDHISGVFFDITKRKLAEEALREQTYFLQTLIDTIPIPIFYKDINGIYLLGNKALSDFLGVPKEEIIGKSVYDMYPQDLADNYFAKDAELFQNPGVQIYDFCAQHADGSRHEVNYNKATYVTADGKLGGLVGVMIDISERKRAEADRLRFSKLESLATLAGGIAHDFNNILTAIMGNISLALLDQQEGPIRQNLAEAERACTQAQNLSRQLLTFAKGGAPVKELVSVENLVTETGSFACRGSKAQCTFSFSNNLWALEADAGQLNQVIQNLIINAMQAMPTGGTIEVQGENLEVEAPSDLPLAAGKYVKLSIKDQGVGIPADHLANIFDPYFTTKQTGSGLGLATAHSVVQSHHGHISVESTLGVGTTFNIYLPAVALKIEPFAKKGEVLAGRGNILVMDDEEMVRRTLEKILRRLGYQVLLARDGAEAIELFNRAQESGQAINLVMLDLTIPGGLGGKETMKQLLKIDPQVKAIVSSGYSEDAIMAEFANYGFSGVIAKPYRILELSKVLNNILQEDKP